MNSFLEAALWIYAGGVVASAAIIWVTEAASAQRFSLRTLVPMALLWPVAIGVEVGTFFSKWMKEMES